MNKQLKDLETRLAAKYKDLTGMMSDNIIYLKDFIMFDGTIISLDEGAEKLDSGTDGESIANGFSSDGKQIYVETASAGGYNEPLENYSPFCPKFKEVFLNYISDENNFDLEDEDVDLEEYNQKYELQEKILREAMNTAKRMINESKKSRKQREKNKKTGKCPVTRKDFMEWINDYTDWIGFHESTSGKTVFMDMDGYDGGDVYEDGLESGAKFANPDSIDKEIRAACKHFDESYPTKSFKDFCKEKYGEQ